MEQARSKVADAILFSLILGFASGIVFDSLASATTLLQACVGAAASLAFAGMVFFKKARIYFLAVSIFLFAGSLGMYRSELAKPDAERFAGSIGQKVSVEGIIVDEPDSTQYGGQKFTLDADGVSMIVTAGGAPKLAYGDKITALGTLALPENFTTDQGTEFDYVSYLYKDDILYDLKGAKAVVESSGHGNVLVAKLIPVKNAIVASFHRVLPAHEADLLGGLNLGAKSSIDPAFRDALVTTGTIHIIALSGYNVTIVANFLRDLFVDVLGLSASVANVAGGICIILFVVMTGLQSSAIRAGIMALIGIFARGKGRTYDAFRALALSCFLMILYDPKYLVYDVSFQLSFLATLGIIFVTPILEQKFARIPKNLLYIIPLREAMSVTLGAQLGVLPFILYKMGTLSLISLPANILVLPAVPIAMGIGALAGLIGSLSVTLAYPASFVTYWLLRYITGTIVFFSKVPYASVIFKQFPLWLALGMYLLLLYWVYRMWNKESGPSK